MADSKKNQQRNLILFIFLCALALAVLIGSWWLWQKSNDTDYQPQPVAQQTAPSPIEEKPRFDPLDFSPSELTEDTPAAVPGVDAPALLDDSDASVLQAVGEFGPALSKWLLPEQQIRKWVLAVDLVADGKLPKRYRPIDYPMPAFKASGTAANRTADPANYQRFSALVNSLSAIDTALLARYYREWLPLLERAYQEQGKADTFNDRLRQAIGQVLSASPLPTDPESLASQTLEQPSVLYRYEDPRLESASEIEKLLWRMGEDNSTTLQMFLRDLRYQLDQL